MGYFGAVFAQIGDVPTVLQDFPPSRACGCPCDDPGSGRDVRPDPGAQGGGSPEHPQDRAPTRGGGAAHRDPDGEQRHVPAARARSRRGRAHVGLLYPRCSPASTRSTGAVVSRRRTTCSTAPAAPLLRGTGGVGRRGTQGGAAPSWSDTARDDARPGTEVDAAGSRRPRSSRSPRRARRRRGADMAAVRPALLVTGSSGLLGSSSQFACARASRSGSRSRAAAQTDLAEGGTGVVPTGPSRTSRRPPQGRRRSSTSLVRGARVDVGRHAGRQHRPHPGRPRHAVTAGVQRVVLASSNHVTGLFERDQPYRDVLDGRHERLRPDDVPLVGPEAPLRPDSRRRQQGRRRSARPDVRRARVCGSSACASAPCSRATSHPMRAGGRRGAVNGTRGLRGRCAPLRPALRDRVLRLGQPLADLGVVGRPDYAPVDAAERLGGEPAGA